MPAAAGLAEFGARGEDVEPLRSELADLDA